MTEHGGHATIQLACGGFGTHGQRRQHVKLVVLKLLLHQQATNLAEKLKVEETSIVPKKTDVTINSFVLCWTPWIVNAKGDAEQAW